MHEWSGRFSAHRWVARGCQAIRSMLRLNRAVEIPSPRRGDRSHSRHGRRPTTTAPKGFVGSTLRPSPQCMAPQIAGLQGGGVVGIFKCRRFRSRR